MENCIRQLRTDRGLSQADVASELGVSRQTIISIETGRYLPSLPLALRIGHLFDRPIEAIFTAQGDD